MTIEDTELLKEFAVESQEHLSDIENQLLTLEAQGDNMDVALVNTVFRAIHSIKGAAGFMGLETLGGLAHRAEEVLNRLRNKELRPTSVVINTLLKAADRLKDLIDQIETSNDADVSEHLAALERILSGQTENSAEVVAEVVAASVDPNYKVEPQILTDEALREFLVECFDNLEQVERDLLVLEREPNSEFVLNSVFRNMHTIKGSAGFLAFSTLERIAHATENVLGSVRSGHIAMDSDVSESMFRSIDAIRKILKSIETSGNDGGDHFTNLIAGFESLHTSKLAEAKDGRRADNLEVASSAPTTNTIQQAPSTFASKPMPSIVPNPTPTATPKSKPNGANATSVATPGSGESSAADSTIRVDVALLDKLMTRVGELVLARNQIMQFAAMVGDSDLQTASQHLNLITTELQEGVMKTRMQPIGNVWSKFPRLVRDLAEICGKVVRIEMQGKETELDKTIIEAIKDPLTHLVRNTVDHGIEKPEVRLANGKPAEGCLYLRAYHEGGQVNIEISDDGGGLNLERIKDKAIEKGLITSEQASRLHEREVAHLIFLPGFSTAEKVSNVSGRGVGMDVVKTNIEKIGGTVDLQTTTGQGTSIKIKIPLTLAIIPALIITNDGNRFAIPQVNLLELVRLEVSDAQPGIEWIQGAPVYRLRGRLLPLVYLRQVLKTTQNESSNSDCINIVVLRVDDRQFGLVVDRINDTEEIVVKPMGKQLKGVPVFAGATIMGDGKVALILDVLGLAHSAKVVSKDRSRSIMEGSSNSKESTGSIQTLLVLGTGTNRRLALPTSQVARLEKIPVDKIEYADNREVVQYRGEILPLFRLASVLGIDEKVEPLDGLLNVVVYTENACSYGLVVNRIIDIVETSVDLSRSRLREGLLGSAIIQDHVTDLVDLPAISKQLSV